MAILQKSWHQPYTNKLTTTVGSSYERMRTYLWHIKDALLSHPTSPWTVAASSNRAVVSLADNWASSDDVIEGSKDTDAGSWIVLKSPASSSPDVWLVLDWTSIVSISDYRCNARITTVEPDFSSLSVYRQPVIAGPICGDFDWLYCNTYSGTYADDVSAIVAADGSFLMTQGAGYNASGDPMTIRSDEHFFMFNRLSDVSSQDPYGFVLGSSNGTVDFFRNPSAAPWRDFRTIHPDGSEVVCSFIRPMLSSTSTYLQGALVDDMLRGIRPTAWPIRVVSTTSGKESYKGLVEDFWWGSSYVRKIGQPGFDGQDMVVMQKGTLWVPALEPYRW